MCSGISAAPPLRADYLKIQKQYDDHRSADRLLVHYLLERRLAARLLNSSSVERGNLYMEVYTELFESLPDHPQHTAERSGESMEIQSNFKYMRSVLTSDTTFLEIGCGDAEMSFTVARVARLAYGLDVTDGLINYAHTPSNFNFLRTTGTNIPLADNSIDVAHSNQLLEHLHPEDAETQVREVVRVLKPGGTYWCCTPNRITGPHDISCYFDQVATGFHLLEYDYASIRNLFMRAGFSKVRFFVAYRSLKSPFPYWIARATELFLISFPELKTSRLLRNLMNLKAIGIK